MLFITIFSSASQHISLGTVGLEQFIGNDSILPTVLMLLGYGLAIASSTYCLTFFFTEHSMAQVLLLVLCINDSCIGTCLSVTLLLWYPQNVVLLVHFFTGLILMVISFIMGLMQTTASANSFLKRSVFVCIGLYLIFELTISPLYQFDTFYGFLSYNLEFRRLSPGFCLADGLASMALLRQGLKNGSSSRVFSWNVTGASLSYLAVESIVYFLLTLGLELLPLHKLNAFLAEGCWKSSKRLFHTASDSYSEPLLETYKQNVTVDLDEDIDVQTERSRVLSGSIDNAIIYLRNLRKVYPGGKNHAKKVAVDSLTFSVQEGECFGFLGTNGAGKTTTLSMLSDLAICDNFDNLKFIEGNYHLIIKPLIKP
ncbi:hypothetical protein RJ639_044789 [Escallonia herrerae]|uniref:ABC transporter domain-containing protein n=1 Tax=Escallonia herrerae TaxID=1293975 RepID=A0AA88WBI4_9ASTE|nr:hypothetical protein RJ639_044789 [Escallonia herrerae]